ncbi:tRNA-specific adenosine deaminase [Kytococcus sp. Marseille-QA3725]
MTTAYTDHMADAVRFAVQHVRSGGLPFVGQLVSEDGYASAYGVNRVLETGDHTAHAEIVALRHSLGERGSVAGLHLLATGEPCGLCYRVAADHGITGVHYAVGRDDAARWGFDYRSSYAALGADRLDLTTTAIHLPVPDALEPFEEHTRKDPS